MIGSDRGVIEIDKRLTIVKKHIAAVELDKDSLLVMILVNDKTFTLFYPSIDETEKAYKTITDALYDDQP